jgi:hypothetical protein
MRILSIVRAASVAAPAALLALALSGCGGSSGGTEGPKPIPVVNPDPNNPLKDVSLENEAQNLDKIRAGIVPAKK